jgi:hypothetical protein
VYVEPDDRPGGYGCLSFPFSLVSTRLICMLVSSPYILFSFELLKMQGSIGKSLLWCLPSFGGVDLWASEWVESHTSG